MGKETALHIGIYGVSNAGKSSLLNRLTGQQAALVSPVAGTTTDPVRRSFEIAGFGSVVFIDTAGVDDTASELGRLRVRKTLQTLTQIDAAIVVLSGGEPSPVEQQLTDTALANDIPVVTLPFRGADRSVEEILELISAVIPSENKQTRPFFGDRAISAGDVILFVCPIDSSAPAGRLILPQVQALRAALDLGAVAVVVQPDQLAGTLGRCAPRLVVTDSQAFREVVALVEQLCPEVEVTSFSVLLAALKGDPKAYEAGLNAVDGLRAGDRVLIIENCSHQVTCEDIGRTKIPDWLREYTGVEELEFVFVSGRDPLPAELYSERGYFALAVQCGGCVATARMVRGRIRAVLANGVPVTNYGMLIRKLRVG